MFSYGSHSHKGDSEKDETMYSNSNSVVSRTDSQDRGRGTEKRHGRKLRC